MRPVSFHETRLELGVAAIGWLLPPELTPTAIGGFDCRLVDHAALHPLRQAASKADTSRSHRFPEDLKRLRQTSRVSRLQSASRTTLFSVVLAEFLHKKVQTSGKDIGVFVATSSPGASLAIEFERRGLREGWDLVDPLVFPHVIPSSVATTVSVGLGLNACAAVFTNGADGWHASLRSAAAMISSGACNSMLVLASEGAGAMENLAHDDSRYGPMLEGSVGVVLSRSSFGTEWQLALLGDAHGSFEASVMPAFWRDATVLRFTISSSLRCANSIELASRLILSMQEPHANKVLLVAEDVYSHCTCGFLRGMSTLHQ